MQPLICLMGPTASGKTALAKALVDRFPFEIISVDSAMIYRGMDIGTAKPSWEELQIYPHHLVDIRNPTESYSAASFCADVKKLVAEIEARGKKPLLVGGTMMYFRALQSGLATLPESTPASRAALAQEDLAVLYRRLCEIDPQSAARIHANDTQRIHRAMEVYLLTGCSLTECLAKETKSQPESFINVLLFPQDRAWLHERIATRFDEMLALGFIDEVRQLKKQWQLTSDLPSMRCVGYRQVLDHLQGVYDVSCLRDKAIAATRQLAKRQLTWLRTWDATQLYDPKHSNYVEAICHFLQAKV